MSGGVGGRAGGGLEGAEEAHVLRHCLLGADEPLGPHDLVLDGLAAEPADPTAQIALADALDVGGRAVLRKAAALARSGFDLRLDLGSHWLWRLWG